MTKIAEKPRCVHCAHRQQLAIVWNALGTFDSFQMDIIHLTTLFRVNADRIYWRQSSSSSTSSKRTNAAIGKQLYFLVRTVRVSACCEHMCMLSRSSRFIVYRIMFSSGRIACVHMDLPVRQCGGALVPVFWSLIAFGYGLFCVMAQYSMPKRFWFLCMTATQHTSDRCAVDFDFNISCYVNW